MPQEPSIRFDWNAGTVEEWEDWIAKIPQSNLLQTWPYAQMMRAAERMMTRFALIRLGDEPVGIFQIQEVSLFGGLFHTIALDRGPLWFKQPASPQLWQEFIALFAKTFPKRFGRRRRFMPELLPDPTLERFIISQGFYRKGPGYCSIWLDLNPSEEQIRKNLKQKWRNSLNAAERSGLNVEEDKNTAHLEWLLSNYMDDRRKRHYPGPSAKIVRNLTAFNKDKGDVHLLRALKDGKPIAAILLFRHGLAATYEIGWTSEEGRQNRAHHFLLWQGIKKLKEMNVEWFDLGGINPGTAEGVTKFKQGLGGTPFETIGLYT